MLMSETVTLAGRVIPVQALRDLLCTAVEGGSNYWARFESAERTPDLDYLSVVLTADPGDGTRKRYTVRAEDLVRGLEALGTQPAPFPTAASHLADAIGDPDNSTGDATTADVVLQMTVFGDVVYG
jgi:hypothetical protein